MWRQLRKICMLELFTVRRMEASQAVRAEEMNYMIRSDCSNLLSYSLLVLKGMISLGVSLLIGRKLDFSSFGP